MKRIGGARRKTRSILSKPLRKRGKFNLRNFFQTFVEGDKVVLSAESDYQKAMYFRRYHGMIGTISGKQGECYKVGIKDGSIAKTLLVHPVHLKRSK